MQSTLYSWQPQDGQSYETIKMAEHEIYPKVPPSTLRKWKQRSASRPGYIPRPPNSFVFFRCDFVRRNAGTGGDLSRRAAAAWKHLPEDLKARYKQRAANAAAEHRQLFPDYVYKPEPRGSAHTHARRLKDTEYDTGSVPSVTPSGSSSSHSLSDSPFLALHQRSISEPLIVNTERCLPSPYDYHRPSRTECYVQPASIQEDSFWYGGGNVESPAALSDSVDWSTPSYTPPSEPCPLPILHQRSISEPLIYDPRPFLPSINDYSTNSRTERHPQLPANIEDPLWAETQNLMPSFASEEHPSDGVDWRWDASAFSAGLVEANDFGVESLGPAAQVGPFITSAVYTPSNGQFQNPELTSVTEDTLWYVDTLPSWG